MIEIDRRAILHACAELVMPSKGYSLHLGLNTVDRSHYLGAFDKLEGAENDARLMARLCGEAGFQTRVMAPSDITRAKVSAAIESLAQTARPGDIVCITFAGHGSQLPDLRREEADLRDETWCLYDAQIRDDELRALWGKFVAGVRLLIISDSCHSGSVLNIALAKRAKGSEADVPEDGNVRRRDLPRSAQDLTYETHKPFYDATDRATDPPACSVIQIGACQDDEIALDSSPNGAFTQVLSREWRDGPYKGNYLQLVEATRERLKWQWPSYRTDGPENAGFEAERVFRI